MHISSSSSIKRQMGLWWRSTQPDALKNQKVHLPCVHAYSYVVYGIARPTGRPLAIRQRKTPACTMEFSHVATAKDFYTAFIIGARAPRASV